MSRRKPIGDEDARQFFQELETTEATGDVDRVVAKAQPAQVRETSSPLKRNWTYLLPIGTAPIMILLFMSPVLAAFSLGAVLLSAVALKLALWRYNLTRGTSSGVPALSFPLVVVLMLIVAGVQALLGVLVLLLMRAGGEPAHFTPLIALLTHFPIMTVVLAVLLPTSAGKAFVLTVLQALISLGLAVVLGIVCLLFAFVVQGF